jgi:hypothetical protein
MKFDFIIMFDQVANVLDTLKKLGKFYMKRIRQLGVCNYEQYIHNYR